MNVWEDKDILHVEAELPGVKDNLDLTVVENELILKGERPEWDDARAMGKPTIAVNVRWARSLASIRLPFDVDAVASRRRSTMACCS